MIVVRGGLVTLGSDDTNYRPSERPAMKVRLDYGFNLGMHEVTCGEYRDLAKKTDLKEFGECGNDSLPLSDVTYYDAVLFANAKSKNGNRDTAYTHGNAVYDTEGHCTNLEALAFHPEAEAYRLPTEAEWVLAASQGWNPGKYSWNAGNSEYRAHAVCSAGKDILGFCDLAGNVKEWVNDWAGSFFDTTVTNYLGAPDGGDLGERVLKGGYFSERVSEMNVVARGDDYTVVGSSRAERIGFRLAFGRIPDPVWLDASGHAKASVVTPLAGTASLKAYTGTYNMVLAFRNDISGNLAYIDYRDGYEDQDDGEISGFVFTNDDDGIEIDEFDTDEFFDVFCMAGRALDIQGTLFDADDEEYCFVSHAGDSYYLNAKKINKFNEDDEGATFDDN
jgi:formylglycine-generating enzyme required for sulfatase activity